MKSRAARCATSPVRDHGSGGPSSVLIVIVFLFAVVAVILVVVVVIIIMPSRPSGPSARIEVDQPILSHASAVSPAVRRNPVHLHGQDRS